MVSFYVDIVRESHPNWKKSAVPQTGTRGCVSEIEDCHDNLITMLIKLMKELQKQASRACLVETRPKKVKKTDRSSDDNVGVAVITHIRVRDLKNNADQESFADGWSLFRAW